MATLHEGFRVNNYLLEQRIGTGSFGEVWRARHHVFDQLAAIKIPTDAQYVRNLRREGVAIHGLRHPNIVRAIDMDPYGDPPYLIMEYVDGPSLRQVIDGYRATLPIDAAVAICRGMLGALQAAHDAGIIHRDIKPGNILLAHPADQMATITPDAVRVTDFGLGRVGGMTAEAMVQSGSLAAEEGARVSGTVAYMSPEQREGRELDARSDLYSAAIVLFEMLTGERPQGHELPSEVRREAPAYLDRVFRGAYCRLDGRFPTAAAMLEALSQPRGVSTPPPPPRTPAGLLDQCPQCGGRVDQEDQFCIHCGRQLVAAVPRCHKCGGFVHRSDRFCIFCGVELGTRVV